MDTSIGDKYLKPKHIENGDEVKIIDEFKFIEKLFNGKPKSVWEGTIQLPSGVQLTATMNKTSVRILSDAWSSDTVKWVGKQALITKNKMMVGDGMKDVLIFQAVAEEKLPF